MQATLPAAPAASNPTARPKPAPSADRRTKPTAGESRPKLEPDPERVLIHERVNAIARSKMMCDARRIVALAEELHEALEAFGDEHDENSIVDELKAAGISANGKYLKSTAANLLYDARGAAFNVECAAMLLSSELLDEDAGELIDVAKKSR
jgi:hypothetical protein